MRMCVSTAILIGSLVSLPYAARTAEDGVETLLTTVRLNRPLHFATPAGEPVIIPPGNYAVAALGTQELQLSTKDRTPIVISATTGTHEEELEQPVALAVPDESAPQLTHLLLLLPDGRTFQSTGSADGVVSRQIPVHIVVAVLKAVATGSFVKNVMQIERKSYRPGKEYQSFTLPPGMCAMLCERDEDCRAFTWKRDVAKPAGGSCQLLKDTPAKQDDECCISGVKQATVK